MQRLISTTVLARYVNNYRIRNNDLLFGELIYGDGRSFDLYSFQDSLRVSTATMAMLLG